MPELKRRLPTGAAIHFNGNLSVIAGYRFLFNHAPIEENYLVQLTFIPVNLDWEIHRGYPILDLQMSPPIDPNDIRESEYACRVKYADMERYILHQSSFAVFEKWFKACKLDPGKKIAVTSYDWPLLQMALQNWLGPLTYREFFETRYCRDIISIASFMNDLAVHRDEQPVFAKVGKFNRLLIDKQIDYRIQTQSMDMARLTQEWYRRVVYDPNSLLFYKMNPTADETITVPSIRNLEDEMVPAIFPPLEQVELSESDISSFSIEQQFYNPYLGKPHQPSSPTPPSSSSGSNEEEE